MNRRLIEVAFPLKQASLDSVHEKNVRHGHISTLHIWPARRPLAACRAALVCTLLPDPGNEDDRKAILERLAGKVVPKVKRKKLPSGRIEEQIVEETEGGILHWGRESGPDIEWFRQKIREAYGGRTPKVLDPFAGGGAIPLEAMRLGCEATAIDINPVAWFILQCTLEYPQKLAGQKRPLPTFALESPEFMAEFLKAHGLGSRRKTRGKKSGGGPQIQGNMLEVPEADLAWHVRAWGWWILQRAKADLEHLYPTVDSKPTVAYLWARTVRCKNCRATMPLLKTRWLSKKDRKRVLLTTEPNSDGTSVVFGIQRDVPVVGGNAAQRREHDRRIGTGTMSRSGATCQLCGTIMTMEDIRTEGQAGRLESMMTAVVVEGERSKEYRLPTEVEVRAAEEAARKVDSVFSAIPFGLPVEPLPTKEALGFRVPLYGFDKWWKLFNPRQLAAIGTFISGIRALRSVLKVNLYDQVWIEALSFELACLVSKLADKNSTLVEWQPHRFCIGHTFKRFVLPMTWDYAEVNVFSKSTGNAWGTILWIFDILSNHKASPAWSPALVFADDAQNKQDGLWDAIITDPPYYDAIPYSDTMDFFYVWLRRTLHGLSTETDEAFESPLGPKWDHEHTRGELIDDASRFNGDRCKSRASYQQGMSRSFLNSHEALHEDGRAVVVFAHKQPEAWEVLVDAMIQAGFVVDASWPIQTEMSQRMRALGSAALSSSVWLVCKKRPALSRPGWDNHVLAEMREKIQTRLRVFWDAGIRGPDFVWAATGPALEAYSKHPVVKKADSPGEAMTVSEFLRHVRRIVVDFVVGRVLSHNGEGEEASGLDDITTYYLLHRHDFGMEDAPVGASILYAISCGLSDSVLADQYDVLIRTGGQAGEEEEEYEPEGNADEEVVEETRGSGSKVRLKPWNHRRNKNMGHEAAAGRPIPLIDQVHRLMHLWKAGDVVKVDDYLDLRGLRRNTLFHQLLQALIELAAPRSEERALLESISNHVAARGIAVEKGRLDLPAS